MEIKVGQIWETRGGLEVVIVEELFDNHPWRWKGDMGTGVLTAWTAEGKYWTHGTYLTDLFKLIKEAEEPKMEQIKVGQVWETRDGRKATIITEVPASPPWRWKAEINGGSIAAITETGRYSEDEETGLDLVRLIPEPKLC